MRASSSRRATSSSSPGSTRIWRATAVWGSQQVGLFPGAKYDGVFALWYGKGPGVDRSLDVLKHGNHAGTSKHGGVLVVAGDDHAAKSSTLPHQSDHVFAAAVIPVLNPSGVQDYLDLGIHGWAMSRYSGCWVAFKAVTDTVESTAVVDVDPHRVEVVIPQDFVMPPGGLSIRWPDPPLVQEARMQEHKAYAALAYCRANQLNRIVIDSPRPRLGIMTAGKSYLDVRQALDDLGIDERLAAEIGLRVMKVGMTWPLEPEGTRHFAEGLEEILVVEEKRQHLEYQLKEELYNWSEAVRPRDHRQVRRVLGVHRRIETLGRVAGGNRVRPLVADSAVRRDLLGRLLRGGAPQAPSSFPPWASRPWRRTLRGVGID